MSNLFDGNDCIFFIILKKIIFFVNVLVLDEVEIVFFNILKMLVKISKCTYICIYSWVRRRRKCLCVRIGRDSRLGL